MLPLTDISINGTSFKPFNRTLQILVDSGCSVIFGNTSLMMPIIKLFPSNIECKNLINYPDITFNIEGDDYILSPADYILKLSPTDCVLGIQAVDFPHEISDIIMMGVPFIKAFYTHLDFGNKRVGFAKAKN